LASFHHCEPDDSNQHNDESDSGMGLRSKTRLNGEDVANDENNAEYEQKGGVGVLDHTASAIAFGGSFGFGVT